MSWQAYVDTNLLASGAVTAAGIYDLQGNPWAYSAGFAAQVAEVASVSAHFPAPTALAATGIVVAGVKYMYVSGDADTEIYGKKGNTGVVFCKCTRDATPALRSVRMPLPRLHAPSALCSPCSPCGWPCAGNTCIVLGFHDDKIQPGSCRNAVGKLADFLKENNI